jgi:ribosomal silencing factor RsfS
MKSLDELKAENIVAWERNVHLADYMLVVNTSCAAYIPALEAEVERLRAELKDNR